MNLSSHCNLVHKYVPMPQAMKNQMQKLQWRKNGKPEKILAWQLPKVKNKNKVIDDARNKGRKVPFCVVDGSLSSQEIGYEPQVQKYRGRLVVLRGDIVKDDSGFIYSICFPAPDLIAGRGVKYALEFNCRRLYWKPWWNLVQPWACWWSATPWAMTACSRYRPKWHASRRSQGRRGCKTFSLATTCHCNLLACFWTRHLSILCCLVFPCRTMVNVELRRNPLH